MSLATASYLARRAAQKERVRILYRRALKDTLNWAVHRHLFYPDADALREKFETNRNVEDIELIDRMIAAGEATYNKWRHPDPYIVPWAPGGTKFCRNPTPPPGIAKVHDIWEKTGINLVCVVQQALLRCAYRMPLHLLLVGFEQYCIYTLQFNGILDAIRVFLQADQDISSKNGTPRVNNPRFCLQNHVEADEMIVSITGATGFIGKRLVQRLQAVINSFALIDLANCFTPSSCAVFDASRSKALSIFPVRDYPGLVIAEEPEWGKCIQGSTAVVNLAGTPISTRWSPEADEMIVSITGATGFVGKRLVQKLQADNHRVRVLTRSRSKALSVFPVKDYPGLVIAEEPEWGNCIQGSTAVVNLAGTPVSQRWTPEIKKEIMESRTKVTSKVVDLINSSQDELCPKVLISATAVGYYGSSETSVFDENSPSGDNYLAEVCRAWEAAALRVNKDVRTALIRIGLVLGKEGGALAKMIPPFKMYAGGHLGSGRQWFSWIHVDDMVNLIYEALRNPAYKGPINGTAPNPVRLSEFCKHLGSTLGRPSWLPVPEFILKFALGEGASVALEGQNVIPARAKELGFAFKYTDVREALRSIVNEKTQA
ncbi:Epimerase family protein SDR39U1, chloroplastic [Sesamum angolense]|uniref:Epimerase family protein SDR39U1, chloroplastic n=1 Tax=Sesamum angolense TaxID=2727404 RepID=A0AAE1X4U6_9LAMI|nr:Epimerase family protein SDR39U1, chloroplastic [Sesamum angolense]